MIVSKRGATFTIMLAGESGLGKTTFVNTLFATTIKGYADNTSRHSRPIQKTVELSLTRAELEENHFKVRLNVIDTPGFGDNVNNKDAWQPIVDFVDDQHESYLRQDEQPSRQDRQDMRVHACLYFIRPTGKALKPLDIEAMRKLSTRVNVIPVVAKADTLTRHEMQEFKERVRQTLESQGIRTYRPADDDPSSDVAEFEGPFSVIGSERDVELPNGRVGRGREYLWGVVEVENPEHCDFEKLRKLLIRSHMLDLIQSTEEVHYEAFRQHYMESRPSGGSAVRNKNLNPRFKEEEDNLRKKFSEHVKKEEKRFRDWEAKLFTARDELNKDLEDTHAQVRRLEHECDQLAQSLRAAGKR
jgi:cell division control protein 12